MGLFLVLKRKRHSCFWDDHAGLLRCASSFPHSCPEMSISIKEPQVISDVAERRLIFYLIQKPLTLAWLLTLHLFPLKAAQWQVSVKSLTPVTLLESHLPVWTVFGLIISHGSKVMLKIFRARPQLNVNRELLDVQTGFRKGRETRDQIANICWIMEKSGDFQKNMYFCFKDYAKAFDCVDHNKL